VKSGVDFLHPLPKKAAQATPHLDREWLSIHGKMFVRLLEFERNVDVP
jgi:hypothetical protein